MPQYIEVQDLEKIVRGLTDRLVSLETRETSPLFATTVANLPAASAANRGRLRYVSNGRKVGEGAGAGTGTVAYSDGTAWRRVGDDTTVAA